MLGARYGRALTKLNYLWGLEKENGASNELLVQL